MRKIILDAWGQRLMIEAAVILHVCRVQTVLGKCFLGFIYVLGKSELFIQGCREIYCYWLLLIALLDVRETISLSAFGN